MALPSRLMRPMQPLLQVTGSALTSQHLAASSFRHTSPGEDQAFGLDIVSALPPTLPGLV